MEFQSDLYDTHYMFLGKERDAREMLHLYIYNYMKKRNLEEAAKIFAEEENIDIFEFDDDDNLLKNWWDSFWPQFSSRMSNQPGGNPHSSAQPSLKEAMDMLDSLKPSKVDISQRRPTGNPTQHNNVVGQPADMLQTPLGFTLRRSGKQPMNTDATSIRGHSDALETGKQPRSGKQPMNTDATSIRGHSGAKEKGKGPLGFPPVKLLPTDITPGPYCSNFSHVRMPVSIQPPPHVVRAPQSIRLETTYPAGENSAYPPAAPNAGEDNWNQNSLTGVRVSAPDGPDPSSFRVCTPAAYLEFMRQQGEMLKQQHSNPADRS